MKKPLVWVIIASILVLVIGISLFIDHFIIGNNIHSNISNSDWVGFFGGYLGAIIGSLTSLIGVIISVKFTKEQLKISKKQYEEEKKLNNIPILDCEITSVDDGFTDESIIMHSGYNTGDYTQSLSPITVSLNIFNIGVGAASNLKYGMTISNQEQDGVFWIYKNRVIRSDCSIKQDVTIYVPQKMDFEPILTIFYDDILGNHYRKSVAFLFHTIDDTGQSIAHVLWQDNGQLCFDVLSEKPYQVVSWRGTKSVIINDD